MNAKNSLKTFYIIQFGYNLIGKFKLLDFDYNLVVFQCGQKTTKIQQSGTGNAFLVGYIQVYILVPFVGIFEIPTVSL